MNLRLEGRKALVTGASQGLGYATARGLALEGCAVAINGRNPEKLSAVARNLEGEAQVKVVAIPGDMAKPDFASELIQETVGVFDGLDLLVTNAGGPPAGKFEAFGDDCGAEGKALVSLTEVI